MAVEFSAELDRPVSLGELAIATKTMLAELLGVKGIGNDHTIVLYSGNNNWFAAYAYWLLKYRGVDNVKLLDGGRKKWELESRLLSQDEPNRSKTSFKTTF